MKAAVLQHVCGPTQAHNDTMSERLIRAAAAQGAELIVLPELHRSRYFCAVEDPAQCQTAEPIPGPGTEWLAGLAHSLGVVIVGSLFERRAPGLYHNTAVVLDHTAGLVGSYRKMHIPDDPGYHEKFYFTPGDLGFNPISTSIGKLGVLVCWDQWFPEAARLMALAGAELLIYPSAIGWDPADTAAERARQLDAWQVIQRSHAVANGLPVLCANRHGVESDANGAQHFWGNSFIAGPQGEWLANAPAGQDALLCVDLDRRRSETVRRIWPFLRDRRIDAYHDLTLRLRDAPPVQ